MTNIEKGLKLKGRPAEIPNCGRDDLPQFFLDRGYKVGVEVGVYKGEYTRNFLNAGLKMYGIDPWLAYGNYNEYKDIERFQKRQDFLYAHTKRVLKPHLDSGLCELIRKTSMDAVEDFEDESIDFVYIDGHHGFRYVAEDLYEWEKKVKKGGVISGHDYALKDNDPRDHFVLQVKYVLHAFVDAFHVENFYVLGRRETKDEEVRDRWRSWFWIK